MEQVDQTKQHFLDHWRQNKMRKQKGMLEKASSVIIICTRLQIQNEHISDRYVGTESLHSNYTIIIVASYMKPCARIDKCRIPTLQNIVRIQQICPQAM